MQRQSRPTLGPKSMGPPVERRAREGPQHIGCFHACRNPVVSGANHDYRIVEGRLRFNAKSRLPSSLKCLTDTLILHSLPHKIISVYEGRNHHSAPE